jgi:hypothetical protein
MKRKIPTIQKRSLYPLANELEAAGLFGFARRLRRYTTELCRRKAHYRTPRGSRTKMTPQLTLRIRSFARRRPYWDNQAIAEHFNVTNARVSEVLHGKR